VKESLSPCEKFNVIIGKLNCNLHTTGNFILIRLPFIYFVTLRKIRSFQKVYSKFVWPFEHFNNNVKNLIDNEQKFIIFGPKRCLLKFDLRKTSKRILVTNEFNICNVVIVN